MTRLISALVVTAAVLSAPGSAFGQSDRVSGTVTYRERMALPASAVVEVVLEDVSRADAPPLVLASARLERPGQVPVRFDLGYNRKSIDPARRYAVRAEITSGRTVLFRTNEPVLVRTVNAAVRGGAVTAGGAVSTGVRPSVQAVRAEAPSPSPASPSSRRRPRTGSSIPRS